MFRLSDMKLRSQLILLVAIAISTMIIVQLFYYVSFYKLTTERAYAYFEELSGQIENKMKSTFYDVESITQIISNSQNIQKFVIEKNAYNKLELIKYAKDNLNYGLASNKNLRNIGITGRNGIVLETDPGNDLEAFEQLIDTYKLQEQPLRTSFYTPAIYDKVTGKMYYAYINPIYSNLAGEFYKDNIGVCMTLCYTNTFTKSIEGGDKLAGLIFTISEGDNIISSSVKDMNNKKLDAELSTINVIGEGRTRFTYKQQPCLARVVKLEKPDWTITIFIPIANLVRDMQPLRNIGILILIGTICILTLVGIVITRSITVPIGKIVSSLVKIGEMDIKYRITIPSKNEIGIIVEDINTMLDKLESMTRRIFETQNALYESELSKKQAELAFYQSQINPHFLYNTLECIRSMGAVYNAKEIVGISTSMAKIFRYSVKKGNMVTLQEELECVGDYFNIISLRYMGKYKIKFIVDKAILDQKIVKMTLQPIIENSVYHGLEKMDRDGYIGVKGYFDNSGDIVIEIVDNGKGLHEEELSKLCRKLSGDETVLSEDLNSKGSIGLLNINQRLVINYGEKYSMQISSKLNHWTAVRIKIPQSAN